MSDEQIEAYTAKYDLNQLAFRVHSHFVMRCCLAPVVEACLLLDRLLYLFEQCSPASPPQLVRVFDPLVSPRCYAFVCTKPISETQ